MEVEELLLKRCTPAGLRGDDDAVLGTEEARDDVVVTLLRIDNATMRADKQFYDRDGAIQTCRERKRAETFRHTPSVGWWYGEQELRRLPGLSSEDYQRLLQETLWKAQDYLNLFRFAAFYYVRDMEAWLLESQALRDGEAVEPGLPFGLVELGMNRGDTWGCFVLERRDDRPEPNLLYVCENEKLAARYDFFVLNEGACFQPLRGRQLWHDPDADLVVVSPFAELRDRRAQLEEAEICAEDANFQATHPESFLFSKPLPDAPIDEVTAPDDRFAIDRLSSARMEPGLRHMNAGREVARASLRRGARRRAIAAAQLGAPSRAADDAPDEVIPTRYDERLAQFERPSMWDTLEELPCALELARGPKPFTLVDTAALWRAYEDRVCQLLQFPHLFFKPFSTDSSLVGASAGSHGQLTFAQRQLEETVVAQQAVLSRLFGHLYRCTFARLDTLLFNGIAVPAQIARLLPHVQARLVFPRRVHKQDEAIHSLMPFYEAGLVSGGEIRRLLEHNYGLPAGRPRRKPRPVEAMPQPPAPRRSSSSSSSEEEEEGAKRKKREQEEEETWLDIPAHRRKKARRHD